MTRTTFVIAAAAVAVVAGLGVLAGVSPEFKQRATTAGIVVLAVMVACGALVTLIAPVLHRRIDTRHRGTATDALNVSAPTSAAVTAAHTGSIR